MEKAIASTDAKKANFDIPTIKATIEFLNNQIEECKKAKKNILPEE